eukprot:GHVS01074621.1.p1 GENE.GHVS01074621.1~~GHVS01074621.1.p1  ORF type:complete len:1065 (-),score=236.75 GHVS01074621.1:256-3450(-)
MVDSLRNSPCSSVSSLPPRLHNHHHDLSSISSSSLSPSSPYRRCRWRLWRVFLLPPILLLFCLHPLHLPLLISYDPFLPAPLFSSSAYSVLLRLPLLPRPSASSLTAILHHRLVLPPPSSCPPSVIVRSSGQQPVSSAPHGATTPHTTPFSLMPPFPSISACGHSKPSSPLLFRLSFFFLCPSYTSPSSSSSSDSKRPPPPPTPAFSPFILFLCRICWWLFTATTEVITFVAVFLFSFFSFSFLSFFNIFFTCLQSSATTPPALSLPPPPSDSPSSPLPPSSLLLLLTLSVCPYVPSPPPHSLLSSPYQVISLAWPCLMPPLFSNDKSGQTEGHHLFAKKAKATTDTSESPSGFWRYGRGKVNEVPVGDEEGGWLWRCWCGIRMVAWYLMELPGVSLVYKIVSSFLLSLKQLSLGVWNYTFFPFSSLIVHKITFRLFSVLLLSLCTLLLMIVYSLLIVSEMLYLHWLPCLLWELLYNVCNVLYTAVGRLLYYPLSHLTLARVGGIVGRAAWTVVLGGWAVAALILLLLMDVKVERHRQEQEEEKDRSWWLNLWANGRSCDGRDVRPKKSKRRRLLVWLAIVVVFVVLEQQLRHAVIQAQLRAAPTGDDVHASRLRKDRVKEQWVERRLCSVDDVVCNNAPHGAFVSNGTIHHGESAQPVGASLPAEGVVTGSTEAIVYLLYECVVLGGWVPLAVAIVAAAAVGWREDDEKDEEEEEKKEVEDRRSSGVREKVMDGWMYCIFWVWDKLVRIGSGKKRITARRKKSRLFYAERVYTQLASAGGDTLEQTRRALGHVWGGADREEDGGRCMGGQPVQDSRTQKEAGEQSSEQERGAAETDEQKTIAAVADVSFGLVNQRKYIMERELHEATLEQCKILQDQLLREMHGREEDQLYIKQLKNQNDTLNKEMDDLRKKEDVTDDKRMTDFLLASSTAGELSKEALVSTMQGRVRQLHQQLQAVRNDSKLLEKQNERLRDEVEDLSVYRASADESSVSAQPTPFSPRPSRASMSSNLSPPHVSLGVGARAVSSSSHISSAYPIAESVSEFLTTLPEKFMSLTLPPRTEDG